MKPTTHFMIDLETMSTEPNAAIVSAACVEFDPYDTKLVTRLLYRAIDLDSCLNAGGVMDASTVKWWLQQSQDARMAVVFGDVMIEDFMVELNEFIGHQAFDDGPLRVWAKPPSFDCVILRGYYSRLGHDDPNWGFRDERDVGTLLDITGIKASDFDRGTRHNALHDCHAQIAAVQAAYQKLRT